MTYIGLTLLQDRSYDFCNFDFRHKLKLEYIFLKTSSVSVHLQLWIIVSRTIIVVNVNQTRCTASLIIQPIYVNNGTERQTKFYKADFFTNTLDMTP